MPNEYTEDYAYLPFGGGQRKCVGDQFAIFESIVSLAMLMRRFDVELDASKHPDGECGMTTGRRFTPPTDCTPSSPDAKVGVGRRCVGCTPKESRH